MLVKVAIGLTVAAMLSACAANRKLPWTAENVAAVGRTCGVDGVTVDTRIIALSGLYAPGKAPPWKTTEACLRRNIRLPRDMVFITS